MLEKVRAKTLAEGNFAMFFLITTAAACALLVRIFPLLFDYCFLFSFFFFLFFPFFGPFFPYVKAHPTLLLEFTNIV